MTHRRHIRRRDHPDVAASDPPPKPLAILPDQAWTMDPSWNNRINLPIDQPYSRHPRESGDPVAGLGPRIRGDDDQGYETAPSSEALVLPQAPCPWAPCRFTDRQHCSEVGRHFARDLLASGPGRLRLHSVNALALCRASCVTAIDKVIPHRDYPQRRTRGMIVRTE
jgi:hypothetical protein